MATTRAISIISSTLRGILSNACPRTAEAAGTGEAFSGAEFKVVQTAGMHAAPFDLGVTVYLYRVTFNTTRRNLPPRQTPDGATFRPSSALDLHYLFSAWAKSAEQQHSLFGWLVRTLEDTPILAASVLNGFAGGTPGFGDTEAVELVGESLSIQDLEDIWEIAPTNQQLSVAYMARMLLIDSNIVMPQAGRIQTRGFNEASLTR